MGFGLKEVEKGGKGRIKNPDPHLTALRRSRLRINILQLSGSAGMFLWPPAEHCGKPTHTLGGLRPPTRFSESVHVRACVCACLSLGRAGAISR